MIKGINNRMTFPYILTALFSLVIVPLLHAAASIDENNKNHTNVVSLANSNLKEQPKIIPTLTTIGKSNYNMSGTYWTNMTSNEHPS